MSTRRSFFAIAGAALLAVQVAVAAGLASPAGASAAAGAATGAGGPAARAAQEAPALVGTRGSRPAPAPAANASGPIWTLETTPDVGSGSQLDAVRCSTAADCLGVGYETSAGTQTALAESWNGGTWSTRTVAVPAGAKSSELTSLSCASATSCTAVGYQENDSVVDLTLGETWNGKSWSIVPTPTVVGATVSELTGISCVATSSCHAVGFYTKNGTTMPFAEIWNGTSWTGQGAPAPANAKLAQLHGIACTSSSSCEAVGNYTNSSNVEETLADTWNGTGWSIQSTPALSGAIAGAFSGVSCASATSCAAVGDVVDGAGLQQTLAEAWNGKAWAAQSTPAVSGSLSSVLSAVSCPTTGSCAAVGWYTDAAKVTLTLADGWNGSTWSAETTASSAGAPASYLAAVACASSAYCSAVGNQTSTAKAHLALAEQWVGSRLTTTTKLSSSADPAVTGQTTTFTATVTPSNPAAGSVVGDVTFAATGWTISCGKDGNTFVVTDDRATCTLFGGFSKSANWTVTAKYSGSGLLVSSFGGLTESVGRDKTSTVVSSSADPAVPGQPVTLAVDVVPVSPGSGAPTGDVTFTVGGGSVVCNDGNSNVVVLSSARASCTVVGPRAAASAYTVNAAYSGDGNFVSSSATLAENVHQGSSTVTLTSSSNPSVAGQAVTFTATVDAAAPATGTPTGTVTFSVTGTAGALSCRGGSTATLSGGSAGCVVGGLSPTAGPYTVAAAYSGDANFAASSNHLTQAVGSGNATIGLRSSVNPSVSGQSVTFTATVSAVAPATGTPSGTVTFTVTGTGGTVACRAGDTVALSNAAATCAITGLAGQSTYAVHAVYSGDANFSDTTATPLTQTVSRGAATTALRASADPAVTGEGITFTANVSAATTPTGTVTFSVDSVGLACNGSGSGVVTVSNGSASCTVAGMSPTSFTLVATYSGDVNYTGSTSAGLTETVDQDSAVVTITSDADPSVYGELFDLTATVSAAAPGAGVPSGTVTFFVNGEQECDDGTDTFTLSGGQATCPIEFFATPGTYSVVADYSGDSNFLAGSNTSTPYTQTVNEDATVTTVTSSSPATRSLTRVTYTGVVAGTSPGVSSPPQGDSVTFTATNQSTGAVIDLACNGTTSDVVTIAFNSTDDKDEADCLAPINVQGTYTVTATYAPDGNFLGSAGTLTETVGPAG